ncbi:efflux RND transporter periplasmic adaptor subunit (plasmid) [Pseudoalteromonas sp. T1lg65]|uniref:efflux RND transporter periplasmic adaptor subunit n=1 Tax=Pseudoalteromonas sp. T1lg65 TaxID=2077101 RepID=UPI003F79E7C3
MNNKPLIIVILLLLVTGCQTESSQSFKLAPQHVKMTVSANGELESKTRALVAPPSIKRMWQYKIKHLVPENTRVKQGQIVASFDDQSVRERLIDYTSRLDQAQKELENKQAQEAKKFEELKLALADAQKEFDKAKRRAEIIDNARSENDRRKAEIDFTIASLDLELAQKKFEFHKENTALAIGVAKSKVARIDSDVKSIKAEIAKLKVTSPIDGVVAYRVNNQGEKPAVGESVMFGQPVIEVSVVEDMQVKAQINEPDFGKVSVGQHVKVTVDSADEYVVSGKVIELGSAFREKSTQDKSRVIDTIIALDVVDVDRLRPGLSTRVEITVAEFPDALAVPVSAIKKQGDEHFVDTDKGQKTVTISHIAGDLAVLAEGVTVGMEINL